MAINSGDKLRLSLLSYGFTIHHHADRDGFRDFYCAKIYDWMKHAGDVYACDVMELVGIGRPDSPVFLPLRWLPVRCPVIASRYEDATPVVIISPGCNYIAKGSGIRLRAFALQFCDMVDDPGQESFLHLCDVTTSPTP